MIKYFIPFLLMIISCNKYDNVLTRFEKKLNTTKIVKKYTISVGNKTDDIVENYGETTLCNKKASEISLINVRKTNGDLLKNAMYALWDNNSKKENTKYLFHDGRVKSEEKIIHEDLEIYLKNDETDFAVSPWLFYLSNKSAHKYNKSVLDNKYGYQWYIFSGKLSFGKSLPVFSIHPDYTLLFEIWIRQDENVWFEFYKNSKNETKVAIEGTFQLSDDDKSIREPENLAEAQKVFYESFRSSLLYRKNILKDSEFGKELYQNPLINEGTE